MEPWRSSGACLQEQGFVPASFLVRSRWLETAESSRGGGKSCTVGAGKQKQALPPRMSGFRQRSMQAPGMSWVLRLPWNSCWRSGQGDWGDLREGEAPLPAKAPSFRADTQCKHPSEEINPIPSAVVTWALSCHAHASTAASCPSHSVYFPLFTFLVSVGAFLLISVDEETGLERVNLPSKPPH